MQRLTNVALTAHTRRYVAAAIKRCKTDNLPLSSAREFKKPKNFTKLDPEDQKIITESYDKLIAKKIKRERIKKGRHRKTKKTLENTSLIEPSSNVTPEIPRQNNIIANESVDTVLIATIIETKNTSLRDGSSSKQNSSTVESRPALTTALATTLTTITASSTTSTDTESTNKIALAVNAGKLLARNCLKRLAHLDIKLTGDIYIDHEHKLFTVSAYHPSNPQYPITIRMRVRETFWYDTKYINDYISAMREIINEENKNADTLKKNGDTSSMDYLDYMNNFGLNADNQQPPLMNQEAILIKDSARSLFRDQIKCTQKHNLTLTGKWHCDPTNKIFTVTCLNNKTNQEINLLVEVTQSFWKRTAEDQEFYNEVFSKYLEKHVREQKTSSRSIISPILAQNGNATLSEHGTSSSSSLFQQQQQPQLQQQQTQLVQQQQPQLQQQQTQLVQQQQPQLHQQQTQLVQQQQPQLQQQTQFMPQLPKHQPQFMQQQQPQFMPQFPKHQPQFMQQQQPQFMLQSQQQQQLQFMQQIQLPFFNQTHFTPPQPLRRQSQQSQPHPQFMLQRHSHFTQPQQTNLQHPRSSGFDKGLQEAEKYCFGNYLKKPIDDTDKLKAPYPPDNMPESEHAEYYQGFSQGIDGWLIKNSTINKRNKRRS